MDSLLGDCEQPPYTMLQSLTPLSPLMTLNHPLLVSNPIVTSVTTTTIVGPKEADSASYSSSLCLSTRATGPNSYKSLTEPGSSPGIYQTSMDSTTSSPEPTSAYTSPVHAPAKQHSTLQKKMYIYIYIYIRVVSVSSLKS